MGSTRLKRASSTRHSAPITEMSLREGTWQDSTRGTLFFREWLSAGRASSLCILLHGFGEHGGRYDMVAKMLADHGVSVVVPDLWGHGRSAGHRGDVRLDQAADELARWVHEVLLPSSQHAHGYVLFGHSAGGLLAIDWAIRYPERVRRMIVQAPLLDLGYVIPRWKHALARTLAWCAPSCGLSTGLTPAFLSHDQAVVQAYTADSLVHRRITARASRALFRLMRMVRSRPAELHVPTLVLYGAEDRVVSTHAIAEWFRQLPGEKRSVIFPNCYHELHHESVRERVLSLIADWANHP